MEYHFRRQEIGDGVRLRLDMEAGMELDEFALHMMNRNDPRHLVQMQMVQKDNSFYLQYDINHMQPLQDRLAGKLERKDVMHLLNSAIEAFEEAEDYMLTEDALVTDMEYVYIDADNECRLLCVPCKQKEFEDQTLFFRRVVERMMARYADSDTLLYDIMNVYNRDGIRKLSDMKDLLRKLGDSETPAEALQRNDSIQQGNASPEREAPVPQKISAPPGKPVEEKPAERKKMPPVGFEIPGSEKKGAPVNFEIPGQEKSAPSVGFAIPGQEDAAAFIPKKKESRKSKKETSEKTGKKESRSKIGVMEKVFRKNDAGKKEEQKEQIPQPEQRSTNAASDMYESYEETVLVSNGGNLSGAEWDDERTVLQETPELSGILVRQNTQERFVLGTGEYVIGSGSASDCVIGGNKAISRQHVVLKIKEDGISVTDRHSSNGTWVDGRRLVSGNSVFIRNRAVIKLADEEFIFTVNRQ